MGYPGISLSSSLLGQNQSDIFALLLLNSEKCCYSVCSVQTGR